MKRLAPVVLGLVVGCSSGGSDGGASTSSSGGSSSGGSSGAPAAIDATKCGGADTSVVSGTLGGKDVDVSGATRSWSWINAGSQPKFDGTFEGGSVHIEWPSTIPNEVVTNATNATLTLASNSDARTFQSGVLTYASPGDESWLAATITFDTGTVDVCMRKSD